MYAIHRPSDRTSHFILCRPQPRAPPTTVAPRPDIVSECTAPSAATAKTCLMCMTESIGRTFRPCGHTVACVRCSSQLQLCFICNSPIEANLRYSAAKKPVSGKHTWPLLYELRVLKISIPMLLIYSNVTTTPSDFAHNFNVLSDFSLCLNTFHPFLTVACYVFNDFHRIRCTLDHTTAQTIAASFILRAYVENGRRAAAEIFSTPPKCCCSI